MDNDKLVMQVASAIALAFNLDDLNQVLLIVKNMSQEGIQSIVLILSSEQSLLKKLIAILRLVQEDIQKNQAIKAQQGAKLEYIKRLRKL